jgi:hypothetical protein
MSTNSDVRPFEPRPERRELVRLVRRIQAVTLELHERRHREGDTPELEAKQRTLEQLRWRLAAVARRAAKDDQGAAASSR